MITGPQYHVSGRLCMDSSQCRQSQGEACWWFYDGCEMGVCVCDPSKYTKGPDSTCIPCKPSMKVYHNNTKSDIISIHSLDQINWCIFR